jgi:hypothetical protein
MGRVTGVERNIVPADAYITARRSSANIVINLAANRRINIPEYGVDGIGRHINS